MGWRLLISTLGDLDNIKIKHKLQISSSLYEMWPKLNNCLLFQTGETTDGLVFLIYVAIL